ncbi:hypothetical protein [Nitrososphaera sp.]|uniref:hypothetical protein n=1 Tax=Nitrososphaera sp. TaxID=1971748 RepID=UPI002ED991F9
MAGADSFAVEQGKGKEAVDWMNEYAKKNKLKFEAKLEGYSMQSVKFGVFELISWKGEWSVARSIMKKVSGKLRIKAIESGYHEKKDLLSSMFGSAEFGKVYSGGYLVGQIELTSKGGRWTLKAESYF